MATKRTKMKPIIILPPEMMSKEDVDLLKENGICVVVSKEPSQVKFVDPIPSQSSRTEIEAAAIKLSRILLNGHWGNYSQSNMIGRETIAKIYIDALVKGSPLDPTPSQQEQERQAYDSEKLEEQRRMAREDARAERAAKKASK